MNKQEINSSGGIKAVAWTNIFAQFAFPVAAAFTPSVATAELKSQPLLTDSQLASIPVKPYILKGGETTSSVAAEFGLTAAQLKKLNQLRTFTKSFESLKAGDEIDVPEAQLKDVTVAPAHSDSDKFDRDLASASTRTAGVLQSSDAASAAAAQAKGIAVDRANQEINNWLSGAGTARAKLNIDNNGRIDGSELDLLIPLHDTASSLTFTQFGARHIDGRTMGNLGIGQRHYPAGDWMYGYNAFFDYDLKRDHSRLGLGLEMARDYLKLGANSYFRTSNWRGSPDVTDHDERPANGFDLRTEAYIPALPQLGGSLTYEQYYGEDVGLFGKSSRSRNPAALTAGLSYTPFPLLSFGIERKQGTTTGEGDTRFNIGFTYDINGSWARQIDPEAVNDKRTLAGTRYDLVERNNEIVLEYRKQELIRLKVDPLIRGESGQTKDINLSVNSKYGLELVRWDDAVLVAAGGSIQQSGEKYWITLPPYNNGGVNTWVVSAVAVDKKGNTSKRAEMQVTVTTAGISITESLFDSEEDLLPADSLSTSMMRLKLEDDAGNPISGLADAIVLDTVMPGATGSLPSFSAFKETSPGVYESLMTVGSGFGRLSITPIVRGVTLAPISIDIVSPAAPQVESLKISGQLLVGSTLSGTYVYEQPQQRSGKNIVAAKDESVYLWGEKGTTAANIQNGDVISTSGIVPGYTIKNSDVNKVIELSLLPRNSFSVAGKVVTVNSSMGKDQGNDTDGDNIIDPTAAPSVTALAMAGSLTLGSQLSATYTFDAGRGDPSDKSRYAWGNQGQTASAVSSTTDTVQTSGTVPSYTLTQSNVGQVVEVSVLPVNGRSVNGTTVTQDAKMGGNNFTDGNNDIIVDPAAAPSVTALAMAGSLTLGSQLSATYTFDAGRGDPSDKSRYAWGNQGQTASAVSSTTDTVQTSGTVPSYTLTQSNVGQVVEVSVLPVNGRSVNGTTVTQDAKMGGNNFTDGNNDIIVDPAAAPSVTALAMAGSLTLGSQLSATYTFDAGRGDPSDKSRYAWGNQGQTASAVSSTTDTVQTSGTVPSYTLTQSNVGQVVEVSVLPVNGRSVNGTTVTQDAKMGGNNFTDGNNDIIVDPAAAPSVTALAMAGSLTLGSQLSATYTFDAGRGDPSDKSRYAWGNQGQTASAVSSTTDTVQTSGTVPSYTLTQSNVGQVVEVSVLPVNGRSVNGTTVTQDAKMGGNNFTDGNNDIIVDPAAAPSVTALAMAGSLTLGSQLSATYTFDAGRGDPSDKSRYAWGNQGQTASAVSSTTDTVQTSGTVPSYTLTQSNVGQVVEVSVLPVNGRSVNGTTVTQDAKMGGNNFTDGNNDIIVDPAAAPSVTALAMAGSLTLGSQLSATYTFDAGRGDPSDKSRYAWGNQGQTASAVSSTTDTVQTSGTVPSYTLTQSNVGQVVEVSVLPVNGRSVNGTTVTQDAKMGGNNFTDGNNDIIVDPAAAPSVTALAMAGSLTLGSQLSATYTFDAGRGDPSDKSRYAWGNQGQTASAVSSTTDTVQTSGTVPSYTLTQSNVGQVVEVSVLPVNGRSVNGTTVTQDAKMGGNNFTDGNNDIIVDPAAAPSVTALAMAGSLTLGSQLSATYTFDAGRGDPSDKSRYAWGNQGQTASAVSSTTDTVQTSGTVPSYTLTQSNVGQVVEVSVLPVNGRSVNGTTVTQDAKMGGNNFTDGNNDIVIDPTAAPSVTGLRILGTLSVGESLTGAYTFQSNNGDPTDMSRYMWNSEGAGSGGTASAVLSTTQTVTNSGVVPSRTIAAADNGKVIELSVLPQNSRNVKGTVVTTNTALVGMILATVPVTTEYNSNFQWVPDANGNEFKGIIWPYDGQDYAGGTFTFSNKNPVMSSSSTGVLYVAADDAINSVLVNGQSVQVGGSCTWNTGYCQIPVNLNIGSNSVEIKATNNGGAGSGNPGALNVVLVSGGQNILTTHSPDDWTFH